MLMTSVKKLRIVNTVGSVIFAIYAVIIHSYPTAFMNVFLVGINIYNLIKLDKDAKNYRVIECFKDESIVQMYLEANYNDIRKFFPDFKLDGGHLITFLVCTSASPVGIMIGKMVDDNTMSIEIDYTIPSYRDCSVGTFLYKYVFSNWDINKIVFPADSNIGTDYLLTVGFVKKDNYYICEK